MRTRIPTLLIAAGVAAVSAESPKPTEPPDGKRSIRLTINGTSPESVSSESAAAIPRSFELDK